jgi:hypothetical protein
MFINLLCFYMVTVSLIAANRYGTMNAQDIRVGKLVTSVRPKQPDILSARFRLQATGHSRRNTMKSTVKQPKMHLLLVALVSSVVSMGALAQAKTDDAAPHAEGTEAERADPANPRQNRGKADRAKGMNEVEHARAERAERPERAERAERAERVERVERPEAPHREGVESGK